MPARPIVGRLIGGIGRLIGGAVASPIGTAIVVGTVGAIIIDKGSDILYPDPGSAPLPLPKDRVHKPKPKPNPFPKPKPHIRPNCEQYDPNNDEHEKKEAKCLQELAEWLQWMSELGMPEMTQPEKIKFLQDCMEREGVDGYMGGGGGSY